MTEWWEKAYPGGPMVPVPGFPRPLYPPDAQGHTPSSDGPDVIAYKRTVWRAGRWEGPASKFDDDYSNLFAHGKSGMVYETGIAGIQRQQNIDDTGFIGKPTFNTLRSIRIPEGLPNAGQMAMDATAANLIAEAWTIFGGKEEHAPGPGQLTRELALEGATTWVGYAEQPDGSNNTIFGDWYGVNYQPWCAIFCTYCYEIEAGGSPSFVRGSNYAYVPYIVADARSRRNGLSIPGSPEPGDLVCYDWGWDGTFDHVGLFEGWTGDSPSEFSAIEGNTSPTNYSNGGGVYRTTRDTRQQDTVFVRVDEP